MFNHPPKKITAPPRHLFFDIDGTLATSYPPHRFETADHIDYYLESKTLHIINRPYPHILHPGAVELLQYVVKNFETVSFFSSATITRNEPFVQHFLIFALGPEKYEMLKNTIKIYSRDHMEEFNKDLSTFTADLDQAILIDDKPHMAAKGQKRNLLITHGADESDFLAMHFHTQNDRYMQNRVSVNTILRVNHVFYVAGLLKRVLESKSKSIADRLYNLQYTLSEDNKFEHDAEMHNDISIYQEGLAELRKFNPQLTFFGGIEAEEMLTATIIPSNAKIANSALSTP